MVNTATGECEVTQHATESGQVADSDSLRSGPLPGHWAVETAVPGEGKSKSKHDAENEQTAVECEWVRRDDKTSLQVETVKTTTPGRTDAPTPANTAEQGYRVVVDHARGPYIARPPTTRQDAFEQALAYMRDNPGGVDGRPALVNGRRTDEFPRELGDLEIFQAGVCQLRYVDSYDPEWALAISISGGTSAVAVKQRHYTVVLARDGERVASERVKTPAEAAQIAHAWATAIDKTASQYGEPAVAPSP